MLYEENSKYRIINGKKFWYNREEAKNHEETNGYTRYTRWISIGLRYEQDRLYEYRH